MVVGGEPRRTAGESLEMIDLEDPENSCTFQEDFPISVSLGMGQLTPNGLFYCGGYSSGLGSKKCFKFEKTKFVDAEFSLTKPRYGASSVLYEDNFVVIGGKESFYNFFSDLEVVPENQTMSFPNLTYAVRESCAVVYKKDIIVTGGWTSGSKKTDKMQIISSSKVEVKSLNRTRYRHGCTTFRVQQKDILVIAGGYKEKSTDFVLLDNNMEIQEGKSSYLKIERIQ